MDSVAVVDGQLQPDHAAERGDALDAGLPAGAAVPLAVDLEVVRADVDLGAGFRREPESGQGVAVFAAGADLRSSPPAGC